MSNPIKILELSGQDWMKGISFQNSYPIGGIFQSSSYNFNPFDLMGYFRPALEPVQLDNTKFTEVTNSVCAHNGSDSYVFFLSNRAGTGTKNLFRVKVSDNTVTSYSLTTGVTTGAVPFSGLASYKGRLIFVEGSTGSFYSVLETGATEVYLGISPPFNLANAPIIFHKAPDGNLYFTTGVAGGGLGRIDTVTGAGTNATNVFAIGGDLVIKDMTTDGTYEIIIADDNPTRVANINGDCRVFFWDMDKADADLVQNIPDSYLISARFVDGRLLVLGASGLWQCGIGTNPKLIVPMSSTRLPKNSYQVTVQGNIMYWASAISGGGARCLAYGSKIGKPIFFAPFQTNQSDNLNVTFIAAGTYFYAGTDAGTNTTKAYVLNSGTTYTNATIQSAPNVLPVPYKFLFAKVTLKSKLTTGQSVSLALYNSEDLSIKANETKSYSASNPIRTFTFKPKVQSGQVQDFEDIYATINSVGGAIVQRVVVYGVPLADYSEKS